MATWKLLATSEEPGGRNRGKIWNVVFFFLFWGAGGVRAELLQKLNEMIDSAHTQQGIMYNCGNFPQIDHRSGYTQNNLINCPFHCCVFTLSNGLTTFFWFKINPDISKGNVSKFLSHFRAKIPPILNHPSLAALKKLPQLNLFNSLPKNMSWYVCF